MKLIAIMITVLLLSSSFCLSLSPEKFSFKHSQIMMRIIISVLKDPEFRALGNQQQIDVIKNVFFVLESKFKLKLYEK
jgi:hypothetical protein